MASHISTTFDGLLHLRPSALLHSSSYNDASSAMVSSATVMASVVVCLSAQMDASPVRDVLAFPSSLVLSLADWGLMVFPSPVRCLVVLVVDALSLLLRLKLDTATLLTAAAPVKCETLLSMLMLLSVEVMLRSTTRRELPFRLLPPTLRRSPWSRPGREPIS